MCVNYTNGPETTKIFRTRHVRTMTNFDGARGFIKENDNCPIHHPCGLLHHAKLNHGESGSLFRTKLGGNSSCVFPATAGELHRLKVLNLPDKAWCSFFFTCSGLHRTNLTRRTSKGKLVSRASFERVEKILQIRAVVCKLVRKINEDNNAPTVNSTACHRQSSVLKLVTTFSRLSTIVYNLRIL